jgi:hypothetical protein
MAEIEERVSLVVRGGRSEEDMFERCFPWNRR